MLADPVEVVRGGNKEFNARGLLIPDVAMSLGLQHGQHGSLTIAGIRGERRLAPRRVGDRPFLVVGPADLAGLLDARLGLGVPAQLDEDVGAEVLHERAVDAPGRKLREHVVECVQRPVVAAEREVEAHRQGHQGLRLPGPLPDPASQPGRRQQQRLSLGVYPVGAEPRGQPPEHVERPGPGSGLVSARARHHRCGKRPGSVPGALVPHQVPGPLGVDLPPENLVGPACLRVDHPLGAGQCLGPNIGPVRGLGEPGEVQQDSRMILNGGQWQLSRHIAQRRPADVLDLADGSCRQHPGGIRWQPCRQQRPQRCQQFTTALVNAGGRACRLGRQLISGRQVLGDRAGHFPPAGRRLGQGQPGGEDAMQRALAVADRVGDGGGQQREMGKLADRGAIRWRQQRHDRVNQRGDRYRPPPASVSRGSQPADGQLGRGGEDQRRRPALGRLQQHGQLPARRLPLKVGGEQRGCLCTGELQRPGVQVPPGGERSQRLKPGRQPPGGDEQAVRGREPARQPQHETRDLRRPKVMRVVQHGQQRHASWASASSSRSTAAAGSVTSVAAARSDSFEAANARRSEPTRMAGSSSGGPNGTNAVATPSSRWYCLASTDLP